MIYGPADYILCFDNQAEAEQFALAYGFATVGKDGKVHTTLATHQYGLCIIGEWMIQTPGTDENGDPYPSTPDGNYWCIFRDLVGLDVPDASSGHRGRQRRSRTQKTHPKRSLCLSRVQLTTL